MPIVNPTCAQKQLAEFLDNSTSHESNKSCHGNIGCSKNFHLSLSSSKSRGVILPFSPLPFSPLEFKSLRKIYLRQYKCAANVQSEAFSSHDMESHLGGHPQ